MAVSGDRVFVERYEQLRREVIGDGLASRGLAVILRQGLAGWMQVLSSAPSAPATGKPACPTGRTLVQDAQSEQLVQVLAAMLLERCAAVGRRTARTTSI